MSMVPVEGGRLIIAKVDSSYSDYAVVAKDKAGNVSQLPLFAGGSLIGSEEASGSESSSTWCFIKTVLM
jgi:hypothetical protein